MIRRFLAQVYSPESIFGGRRRIRDSVFRALSGSVSAIDCILASKSDWIAYCGLIELANLEPNGIMSNMDSQKFSEYLKGQLLIAMPDIGDPRFDKSVVLLCFHSDEGAMGVVLNKPAGLIKLSDIVKKDGEVVKESPETIPFHFGGPVEQYRAMIVHTCDCESYSSTNFVSEEFGLTTTPDILEDISNGKGPAGKKLLLGYAGWSPGQLEEEIQKNAWLVCDSDPGLIFETGSEEMWNEAVKSLGIAPSMLSSVGGRA